MWLRRWGPAVLLALAVAGAVGWLVWLVDDRAQAHADLRDARRDLADLRAVQEAQEQALAVHRVYVRQAEEAEARWAELERELQSMEGRDARLSDHLRAAAERLWP